MSRIEDVLYADSLTQDPPLAVCERKLSTEPTLMEGPGSSPSHSTEDIESPSTAETPNSKTLSDFMGWNLDQGETTNIKKNQSTGNLEFYFKNENEKLSKSNEVFTNKKVSYMDKLENLGGFRSPARF